MAGDNNDALYNKLFNLGIGLGTQVLGGNDPQVEKAGYQGGIPDYIASRTAVPGTNNPARRPGSGGQRYFTDINFEGPAADTAGLAALNAANPSLESSLPAMAPAPAPMAPAPAPAPMAPAPAPMAPPGSYLGGPQDPFVGAMAAEEAKRNPNIEPGFYSSPEYGGLPMVGTADMSPKKYFGPGSSSIRIDAAYEAYLTRTGQTDRILPDPSPSDSLPPYNADQIPTQNEDDSYKLLNLGAGRPPPPPRVGWDIKPEGESDQDWQQYLDAAEGMRKYRKESGDMGRWMGDAEGGYDHWKRQQEKTAANKEKYGPEYSGLATSIDGVFTHVDRYGQPLPYYNRMYAGGIAQLNSGAYLNGASDGMADRIPATIEGSQEARLSDGEFVIPADVVGGLGNGNSSAGAKTLYNMMDRVRMARTGTKKQGTQINPNKMMPV